MVSTISTNVSSLSYCSNPHLVKAGGYYYAFYYDNTDKYIKYKSSPDGVTWSAAANASHLANTWNAGWTILFDGASIFLAYAISDTAIFIYCRKGTPNAGTISWNDAVTVLTHSGSGLLPTLSFCKTNGYVWLSFYTAPSSVYHIVVYRTSDGTVWNSVLDEIVAAQAVYVWITSDEHEGADRVLIIYSQSAPTTYFYRVWNGSAWSAPAAVGEKPAGLPGPSYFDLWTANGEIHFVYITASVGSAVRYRRYTTSWQDYVTIDANIDIMPTISNDGDKLRVFYRRYTSPTAIFYREMNYTTHAWGDEKTLVSGRPATLGTPSSEKEATDFYDAVGVTWREGAIPYTYQFEVLTIGSATPPAPSTEGPPAFIPWLKTRPVPREVLEVIVDYYKLKGNETPGR